MFRGMGDEVKIVPEPLLDEDIDYVVENENNDSNTKASREGQVILTVKFTTSRKPIRRVTKTRKAMGAFDGLRIHLEENGDSAAGTFRSNSLRKLENGMKIKGKKGRGSPLAKQPAVPLASLTSRNLAVRSQPIDAKPKLRRRKRIRTSKDGRDLATFIKAAQWVTGAGAVLL